MNTKNTEQVAINNMIKTGDFREGETREDFNMSKIAKDDSLELKNISMMIETGGEKFRGNISAKNELSDHTRATHK